MLAAQVYNLQTIVYNALSKRKREKPKGPSHFHPYVKPVETRTRVTAKGIHILKEIGNALCQKR